MTHLENLEKVVGSLKSKKILDVGSGKGEFLVDCALRGYDAIGVEINSNKIDIALSKADKLGLKLEITNTGAEHLPFENSNFDFVNVCEVIEHVREPETVLHEVWRVLKPGGEAYMSVHNRFGFYDTHFHVYFLGWLPRFVANFCLFLLGKHKDYKTSIDRQNIKDMHYFTFTQFSKVAKRIGFNIIDAREQKRKHLFKGLQGRMILFVYKKLLIRFYFSTFHFILTK